MIGTGFEVVLGVALGLLAVLVVIPAVLVLVVLAVAWVIGKVQS